MKIYEVYRTDDPGIARDEFQAAIVRAISPQEAKSLVKGQEGVLDDLSNLKARRVKEIGESQVILIDFLEA
jgi:hypothetical protein